MSAKISARASELGTLLTEGTTGFTVRKRTGVGLFIHFFLLTCMVILGAALLVYYKSPEGCLLAVVIGGCFAMVAHSLERMKRVKQSLEFMNALFSSAMGKGFHFCCIVKNSGEVVFYNRPFQSFFPAFMTQDERTLNALLASCNMPEDAREKIKSLIGSTSEGSVSTTVRATSSATDTALTISFEPIERPTGFFMLRGK